MSDIPDLTLAFVTGLLLGAFFFAGLWWTVQKGMTSEMPALWFVGSLLLRTGVIVAGFYGERSILFGSRCDLCCSRKCLLLKMIPTSCLVV